MTTLHVVVPDGLDDPERPSGGNVYDRRVCTGLAELGWLVREHPVTGEWPCPGPAALARLDATLAGLPDGSLVLVDGLVSAPDTVARHVGRLRLVVLVHLPLALERPDLAAAESRLLGGSAAVVTTSAWCRSWLLAQEGLDPDRVVAVPPGVDLGTLSPGSACGGTLLIVGRVSRAKGHDVLVEALAALADLPWRCVCLGPLGGADPDVSQDGSFVTALRARIAEAGLTDRIELRGAVAPSEMTHEYASADLLVLPSRGETYGMVVTEALAHGVPVVASAVGGVPEALGRVGDDRRPGLLIRPGDADVLQGALRWWLSDPALRADLRDAARARRGGLDDWSHAARRLSDAVARAAR